MNKGMDSDAARFDRIKQAVSGRANDKSAHWFLEQRCDFRVSEEVLKSQVKFVNQLRAGACSKSSKSAKIWTRSFSAPCFQMISGIRPFQKPIAQIFPTHATFGVCSMLVKAASQ